MKKVLFVCSSGGHWVQMTKIMKELDFNEFHPLIGTCSNVDSFNSINIDRLPDFNKDKIIKTVSGAFTILKYILAKKPDIAISTGAAPGIVALFFVKLRGGKTIWIDSIANTERLSLSGKMALRFCSVVLTQWPHLADGNKIQYKGRVI
ncbi:polysaccharide biosynthesis protein [Erwinia sp. JUb26]|uniref:polysaccharide biosynthesis protein n=1 Tax=Erwinia sp. JUb26 TaxID=2485126 RepID=UPI000F49A386|nr:polysaccharide biosynthesis protein [Erwinia sp. JUb26]ROR07723.1 oligosaccharide biosynthesis protein Alg14 [Erwinia sp. JUb26]